jgi:hypothetical protein
MRDDNNQRPCLRDKVEGGIEWVLSVKNNQTSYSEAATGSAVEARKTLGSSYARTLG